MLTLASGATEQSILYARLLPRVKALVLDLIVYAMAITSFAIVGAVSSSFDLLRASAVAMFAVLVFYEPLLVWRYGGTWGHMRYNLRVVADATGRNPTLLASTVRWLLKTVLGVFSFFFMALTQRHQALHDSASRTTVQVRDASTVRQDHFAVARSAPVGPVDVSPLRRVVAILVYEAVLLVPMSFASIPFVSEACFWENRCSRGEDRIYTFIGLLWILAGGAVMVLGWKGKLLGARSRVA